MAQVSMTPAPIDEGSRQQTSGQIETIEMKTCLLWRSCLTLFGALAISATFAPSLHAQGVLALRGATIETASKEGKIEGGTILIRDGKIEAVGADVEIPLAARVIDLKGKSIIPGIVDPYYVVSVGAGESGEEFREVSFGGRTFRIPVSPAAAPTSFVRIADGFDPRDVRWWTATRSGITTANLVARGFGESVIAKIVPENNEEIVTDSAGQLFFALTNQTSSLDVLRKGLEEEKRGSSDRGPSTADRLAALRARMGQRGPGGPPSGAPAPPSSSSRPSQPEKPKSAQEKLWDAVKQGQQPIFVNVNNAASILYLTKVAEETAKAKVALVADGDDLFRTLEQLDAKKYTVIMPPRISLVPNSRDRVNVAKMLQDEGFEIAFSLTLNQNEYRQSQESPLFAVSMLVRSGLDRERAVKALTIVPAKLMGVDKEVGSLEKGKRADLVILDSDPFSATARVMQVLVDGETVYEDQ